MRSDRPLRIGRVLARIRAGATLEQATGDKLTVPADTFRRWMQDSGELRDMVKEAEQAFIYSQQKEPITQAEQPVVIEPVSAVSTDEDSKDD